MSDDAKRIAELDAELADLRARTQSVSADELVDIKLMEAVHAGVVKVNSQGGIELANQQALEFLGLSFDVITGKYTADFKALREDGTVADWAEFPVTIALSTGQTAGPKVLGVERPDKTVRWGMFKAVPLLGQGETEAQTVGAVVSFTDITARREAEVKLRASEARLSALLEGAATQIMYVDTELKIRYLSRYEDGHSPEQVLGLPIAAFLPPADRERVAAVLEEVLDTGEPATYEVGPNPPAYQRWYSTTVARMVEGGKVTGLVANITDMTEFVELQSRLLVADRLASQGTLAASVAHEINNPLTYVLASLHRIADKHGSGASLSSDKLAAWVASATEGAERIRNVVRDLASLSRPVDGKPTRVRIEPVLESSIRMAQVELQHRAKLVQSFDSPPSVLGDESRLGQVFLNLIINAAQSIPVGDIHNNRVEVHAAANPDGWAVVEVRDTGEGISDEVAQRIFEPFVTTKDVEGTGLGLYVCASIVRALGGRLTAAANSDVGSTFRVELPPAKALERKPRSSSELPAQGRARVLVIDDEAGVREFLQDALMEHEVTVAASGREALELLSSGRFDVVFCDLIMPEVSGMEVFAEATEARPELAERFVFITGGAFTTKAKAFVEGTSLPLLQKPFAVTDIHGQVVRLLGIAQAT